MIQENIKKWHDHIKGDFPGGFDELLADDVIFYSPIVFSPQKGKELTTLYLMAAGNTFGGDKAKDGTLEGTSFRLDCLTNKFQVGIRGGTASTKKKKGKAA